jgi:hypothetical protein
MKTKSKISAYILRGSTAALLVLCVIVALSSAINLPNKRPKFPTPQNNTTSDVNGPDGAALRDFTDWASNYSITFQAFGFSAATASLVPRGVELARERRLALLELIETNPATAIAVAVPAAVRRILPAEVLNELETPVSGIGDFHVLASLSVKGGTTVSLYERIVSLAGRKYRAHVYGRRSGQTTKLGIPLHGIAIDGELALHESSVRQIERYEAADSVVDISKGAWAAPDVNPLLAEVGGTIYRVASLEQLNVIEARLEVAEAGIGPQPHQSAIEIMSGADQIQLVVPPQAPPTPWTIGTKQVLVIRVDFSDRPGAPGGMTAANVQTIMDTETAPFFVRSSYQLTNLVTTVTTSVYRMPQTAAYYAANNATGQLHTDAENLAAAHYPVATYDRVIVFYSLNDPSSGGGIGDVGGRRVWINNYFNRGFTVHELGHTYGNWHANLWQVNDGNPASPAGHHVEYGDPYDIMGGGGSFWSQMTGDVPDYNEFFKNRLRWIADSQVINVTTSGTYRIYRFDDVSATGQLALKISRGIHDYWIGARRAFPSNSSMENGAYIVWGYDDSHGSELLDMTTPGISTADAALAIGATFVDHDACVSIRPVAEGGVPPHQFLDIEVNFDCPSPTPTPSPTPARCVTPPSGMVAWWPGDGNPNDIIGGHNGTISGGVTFVPGMVAHAFDFNGTNGSVNLNPNLLPTGSAPRTVDFWFNARSAAPDHEMFFHGDAGLHNAWGVDVNGLSPYNTVLIQVFTWSDDMFFDSGVPLDTWMHIAVTYDGNVTVKSYINGVLKSTKTLSSPLTTATTYAAIGHRPLSGYFNGLIDEVEVFDRPLSQTEIMTIVHAGSAGKCKLTNPATLIGSFSARLNGSVDPHGLVTTVYFQYGTTTSYGSTTASQTKTGNTYQSASANISGLAASTTYHFRIVASNSHGISYGSDRTFTTLTPTGHPVVVTNTASLIASFSATLNGSVDPHGLSTSVYFQYGTTISYGLTTAPQTKTGNTYQNVNANVSGLSPSTTYHFRIIATNSGGTVYGSDRTFTTP